MDHTKELIKKAQEGDKQARDRLVEENMGLVYSTARKYTGRGYDMEDIVQIGVIGLIKGIDRFDLSYDVKFSTYAVVMIVGEVKRFLRDDGMVKVSRSIKENGMKIRRAREELATTLMREPTIEELANQAQITAEDVVVAQEALQEVESIHKTIYQSDGNEIYLVDRLSGEKDEKEELLNHMLVHSLMEGLTEQEQKIIRMRYFENKTQTEVAKEFGISQVQVSRMEKKILLSMRKRVV
ncbi:MAG: SigF/SigG family RNA polymerase sporulation sigma factor [Alistipes sp.]|nr:SigF/SigG family RNA polymerase sporulation sigma factor [Alistipes sp.]